MGRSVHDVVRHHHASVRSIILPRMIRWIDLRAVGSAHPIPVLVAFRWHLQRRGRWPRWTASRLLRRTLSRLPRRTWGSLWR
eukprot:2354201-Pyramimonas_sp.AAC.1